MPEAYIEIQDDVAPPPYRDDPHATVSEEKLMPYRDDPDAVPVEEEADDAVFEHKKRQMGILRVLRKLSKTTICILVSTLVATLIAIVFIPTITYDAISSWRDTPYQPVIQTSGLSNHNMHLPKIYPSLEDGASDTCHAAWTQYPRKLTCHSMILSPAWDNGDATEVQKRDADPFFWSEAVCTNECKQALGDLESVARACINRTDRFDLANSGDDYTSFKRIEEGPLHLYMGLSARYRSLCRVLPDKAHTQWGTCATDLWMDWGVVDGRNEAQLNGLDDFMRQTSVKKTIPGGVQRLPRLLRGDTKGMATVRVKQRSVGPGNGETGCSACTVSWLARKMQSFEFGMILDPNTGDVLGLSDFRGKLRSALLRCDAPEVSAILDDIDAQWTKRGWWCGNKACSPSIDSPSFSFETKAILHGWPDDSAILRDARSLLADKHAPALLHQAARLLYDTLTTMPCGYAINANVRRAVSDLPSR